MQSALRLLLACVSILPTPVLAQAVTRGDLIGTWWAGEVAAPGAGQTIGAKYDHVLTLQADSTWSTRFLVNGSDSGADGKRLTWLPQTVYSSSKEPRGRWRMAGDTLWFLAANPPAKSAPGEIERYKIALQGQQLSLGRFADTYTNNTWAGACPMLFTRIDPSKPLPSPPSVLTIQRADLVGRWVSKKAWMRDSRLPERSDTLTFRPDSTWTHTVGDSVVTGTWSLLPGDRLNLKQWKWENDPQEGKTIKILAGIADGQNIQLQGGQLFLYNGSRCEEAKTAKNGAWAYQRVSP